MPRILAIFLVCLVAPLAFGQSLWQPGFSGYLEGTGPVAVGEAILVTIDTNTKLTYSASNVSDRSITLQFNGGGSGGLFSFLPEGTSADKSNIKGDETVGLRGSLMTRVQRVDTDGLLLVEGSRSMSVNGREQVLSISGLVDPQLLKGNSISFSDLADAKLVYRSILESAPVLTASDVKEVMQKLTAQPVPGASGGAASGAAPPAAIGAAPTAPPTAGPTTGAAAGTAPTAGQVPAAPASQVTPALPQQPSYSLTDATKKELLLQYLNAILGLIFQPAAAPPPSQGQPGPSAAPAP